MFQVKYDVDQLRRALAVCLEQQETIIICPQLWLSNTHVESIKSF